MEWHIKPTALTITGATVTVTCSTSTPPDGRLLISVEVASQDRGVILTDRDIRVSPLPAADTGPVARLAALGASFYSVIGGTYVGYDAATGDQMVAQLAAAQDWARRLGEARDQALAADIRARHEVRRVLFYAYTPPAAALTLGYQIDGDRLASLPGVPHIKISTRCPSRPAITRAQGIWGSFFGCDNDVYAICNADWDLLIRETAAIEEADNAASEAAQAALAAEAVPPEAVAAYHRYGGDADRAWEAGDERSWHLINRYGPAIEAQ